MQELPQFTGGGIAKWLFFFRRIDAVQADFDLLAPTDDPDSIPVGDASHAHWFRSPERSSQQQSWLVCASDPTTPWPPTP